MDREQESLLTPDVSGRPAASAPISAYIRTRNEARLIGDVVAAALQVAAEVIVVDSGSTDDTVARAEAAGARSLHQPWLGGGKQKRFAEDHCRFDWLLDLDADEIVTPELAAEIRAIFAAGDPDASCFRTPMAFAPPIGAPWKSFGLVTRHKLYDRRRIRQPDHEAWDQFEPGRNPAPPSLREPILHHSFRNIDHLTRKVNANSTTRARLLPPKPEWVLVLRIFFGLPIYAAKRFLFDGLWRAGAYGFAFSVASGYGRWLKDVKMYEKRKGLSP